MEFHEYAGIFPLLEGREFSELCADIKANGQREPIWIYEGKVLDGRNRFRACEAVGVVPRTAAYTGDDALAFVLSLNLHRRHLSESQRGMVAAKVANIQFGDFTGNQHTEGSANLHTPQVSQSQAAEMLNVSPRTVAAAVKVRDGAVPELVRAVEAGRVKVSAAADVATLPKEEQTVIVAKGEKEILEAAKQIRIEKAEIRKAENDKLKEASRAIPLPAGKYRTIVIDPPWEMKKIARDVAPDQVDFDYPTMDLAQIAQFPVADMAHDEAIVFCWTTQKYLPDTFAIIEAWGFKYLACMVWHKNGGFQPFGLPQYNAEFVLIGRKGGCDFVDTKAFMLCNNWPRREHSRKPDEFYELISRVTLGPRIDVFSRERREGFDQFGNQTEKFDGAA